MGDIGILGTRTIGWRSWKGEGRNTIHSGIVGRISLGTNSGVCSDVSILPNSYIYSQLLTIHLFHQYISRVHFPTPRDLSPTIGRSTAAPVFRSQLFLLTPCEHRPSLFTSQHGVRPRSKTPSVPMRIHHTKQPGSPSPLPSLTVRSPSTTKDGKLHGRFFSNIPLISCFGIVTAYLSIIATAAEKGGLYVTEYAVVGRGLKQ